MNINSYFNKDRSLTLSKVSEVSSSLESMAETWGQQLLKEAAVRETSEAIGSQIERMEEVIAE